MQVVVAGQGYVGLPLAVRAAEVGHRVLGYDVDTHRVQQLAAGHSYVEDVASSRLRAVLDAGNYSATADSAALADFDIAVITVPTPLRDGVPDLSFIESCARILGKHLRPGATVVLESTTYPGTTEELLLPILEKVSGLEGGADSLAGFSPERIAPGNKRWSFEGTPKLVSGIDARSLAVIKGFYDDIFQTTVPVSGTKIAELAKLIENTFRFVNISLVNEMASSAESRCTCCTSPGTSMPSASAGSCTSPVQPHAIHAQHLGFALSLAFTRAAGSIPIITLAPGPDVMAAEHSIGECDGLNEVSAASAAIVAPTPALADRIGRLTGRRFTDRLTAIPWGIPLKGIRVRDQPSTDTGPLSLVHAGRLDDNKSTITAIEALQLTINRIP
ncbi:nucleotide sugar dehydrogenase [Streptomyces sp. NBC_00727]|uniref:nucleotide sugar dehydrogenase n=1 Tax=Streptomyces sp. NBC_00727 TaxID=2903675 RepID=UPI00386B926A